VPDVCSVRTESRSGWEAVVLESDALRVTVLPRKGADIYELTDVESGVDPLFKAPWGLQPPESPPREGSGEIEFLWNYEGGWQELFPNANDGCMYDGMPLPFHGEVATVPWDWEVVRADAEEAAVRFGARCRLTRFSLERLMRVRRGSPELVLEEVVRNESDQPAHFVWGHHCVVGPPFLERGARIDLPATTMVTRPELWEETARLEPGQTEAWPYARLRAGGTVDLREVAGVEAGSHDDLYVTGLESGSLTVSNPRLRLGFRLSWDAGRFPWVVLWQAYGGALELPLAGSYALGVEPWTARHCLEHALAAGEATELAARGELRTTVRAGFVRWEGLAEVGS
jgi:hypothetical protein